MTGCVCHTPDYFIVLQTNQNIIFILHGSVSSKGFSQNQQNIYFSKKPSFYRVFSSFTLNITYCPFLSLSKEMFP